MLERSYVGTDPGRAADSPARRRHSAGEDPAKREQILDGALAVFLDDGFDGASMNDVCRVAGVSKGTLYVYFADKEDLFVAMVERERDRLFDGLTRLLDGDAPLPDRLQRYGLRLASILCSEQVVRAQRIIIGTVGKMPEMAVRFYEGGAQRTHDALQRFLERETGAGRLRVPDPSRAAFQFVELATAGLWRRRLFGKASDEPDADTVAACVGAGVAVFMAAYGPRPD